MKGACALVVDHSTSSRPVMRRLLSELGMKTSSVHVAESFEEASQILRAQKPQVILSEFVMGPHSALDLYKEHCQVLPNRLDSMFIVLSSNNSPSVTTVVGEADIDALLVRPLNYNDIRDKFIEVAQAKSQPTPYIKMLEAGRRFFAEGRAELALQAFNKAIDMEPKPSRACALKGELQRGIGQLEGAIDSFSRGLHYDDKNYRCLLGLFETYFQQKRFDKAFEAAIALAEHYPIHPRRIPEMIRLCILNEQFVEVLRFASIVAELEAIDETLGKYVTAGLFICGKHLLKRGRTEEALCAFRKAEKFAHGKISVLREIVAALLSGGRFAEAEEMLARLPVEVRDSPEVKLAVLEQLHLRGAEPKAFLMSSDMIREGLRDPRIFEIALLQAKALNRPQSVLQDLMLRAVAAFPDQKETFEKIADSV